MSALPPGTEVFDTAESLVREAARSILGVLGRPGSERRAICLSGGSTPDRLYGLLAGPDFAARVPWASLHLFWGDERLVPEDDESSNGRRALGGLKGAPIPPENIHRIPTAGLTAEAGAAAYERELKAFHGSGRPHESRPLFDVVLLGLGEDGHTASLFPGRPEVDAADRWVVDVREAGQAPHVPRISLTIPALSSSGEAMFLVTGAGKRSALAAIAKGEDRPAARIRSFGRVRWLVTRDAVQSEP